jgi:ABC-type spermidine/putrescine transport system permease subunit I
MDSGAAQAALMYFVLPVWLAAGFADYLCHRASSIESTSGWKESLLHLLQFGEMAVPTLMAILLEINSLIIAIMIVCLLVHEATAIWDVSYAYARREVRPVEQHVHSFLEMLPLMGLLIIVTLHWEQFLSLIGISREPADYTLRLKQPPLPWIYVGSILSLVVLFEVLPYLEELIRGIRGRKARLSSDWNNANQACSQRDEERIYKGTTKVPASGV